MLLKKSNNNFSHSSCNKPLSTTVFGCRIFGAKKENITLVHHCQGEYKELIKKENHLLLNHEEFCTKYGLPKNKKFILFAGLYPLPFIDMITSGVTPLLSNILGAL